MSVSRSYITKHYCAKCGTFLYEEEKPAIESSVKSFKIGNPIKKCTNCGQAYTNSDYKEYVDYKRGHRVMMRFGFLCYFESDYDDFPLLDIFFSILINLLIIPVGFLINFVRIKNSLSRKDW